jgi:hypothetical protein
LAHQRAPGRGEGKLDTEIIRYAQEMEANLIVLGYPEKAGPSEQQALEERL